jgi:hypothetical protein
MFGKKYSEAGEAVIVEKHVKHAGDDGRNTLFEWVADVTPSEGPPFRAVLDTPGLALDFREPDRGDQVSVLIDPKTSTARFDKSDPRVSLKASRATTDDQFAETVTGPVGSPATGKSPLDGTPVTNFAGAQVMNAAEAAPFLQNLLSGNPAARDQAIADLRSQPPTGSSSVPDRLAELDRLKAAGAVNDTEYEVQRQKIIASI